MSATFQEPPRQRILKQQQRRRGFTSFFEGQLRLLGPLPSRPKGDPKSVGFRFLKNIVNPREPGTTASVTPSGSGSKLRH